MPPAIAATPPSATAAATSSDLDALLEEVARTARPFAERGEVASYIPSLAELEADGFAMAAVEMDGTVHGVGDLDHPFPIQSISKVFALVLAMQLTRESGSVAEQLWARVGREPSGGPFNSLVQLEYEQGIPRNPMINAGALVVDDILLSLCDDPHATLQEMVSEVVGEDVGVDDQVYRAEGDTGFRNRAMTNLMRSFDNIEHDIDDVLDLYNFQCSLQMTTRQLARSVRFLANDGVDPATGRQLVSSALSRRVAAIMLTCGTYDAAGDFAYNVGLPCKSGVAGAICSLVPHAMGLAVWSPPLEPSGNSAAGKVALHELAEQLELSIF